MEYTSVLSISPVVGKTAGKSYTRIFDAAVVRLFGCRHRKLSRPFTGERQTYIACLTCGMRRAFDPEKWTPYGSFYAERICDDFPAAACPGVEETCGATRVAGALAEHASQRAGGLARGQLPVR